MKLITTFKIVCIFFIVLVSHSNNNLYGELLQSRTDELWDDRFGKIGVYGHVHAVVADNEGNVYIGGEFSQVNDGSGHLPVKNIVKWDGTAFRSLGEGIRGSIYAIAIDDDGNVYVGGHFSEAYQYGGVRVYAHHIAKWDGTYWSQLGHPRHNKNGLNRRVSDIHVINGIVYVSGQFTAARQWDESTLDVNYIAAWDGSNWSALGEGMNSTVSSLASRDGILYAAGSFHTAGGVSATCIAQWNGSEWSALAVDPATVNLISAIAFGPDGNLYVGGSFIMIGGISALYIAMFDGEQWMPLGEGIGSITASINTIKADDSYVYVGGGLMPVVGGKAVNSIARWDGSEWSAMDTGMYGGLLGLGSVYDIALYDNNVYAGGTFAIAGDASAGNIARWDGSKWHPLGEGGNQGLDFFVNAIGAADHGIYVGGGFKSAGSTLIPFFARWDGEGWNKVGDGVSADLITGSIDVIAVHDENVFVGGLFSVVGISDTRNVAMWDGISWHSLGGGVTGKVKAIAVDEVGDVYVGGEITAARNPDGTRMSVNYIARWDGEEWHSLGNGVSDHIYALQIHDGDLYAGGRFRNASGKEVNFITRWDGSSWHDLAGGMNLTVTSLASDDWGNLYAGGVFQVAGGQAVGGVARWDGSEWHRLSGGVDGFVYALAFENNILYAGGLFENADGVTTNSIARWVGGRWLDMDGGVTFEGAAGQVHAIAAKDYMVFVGGNFIEAGGESSYYFAAWTESERRRFEILLFSQTVDRGYAVETGSEFLLKWTHAPAVTDVDIDIRYGGPGEPWEEISSSLPADTKEYLLLFGSQEFDEVYLRIRDEVHPEIYDTSGPFSINTPEIIAGWLRIPQETGAYKLFKRQNDAWSFSNDSTYLWPYDTRFPDWETFCLALSDGFCYMAPGIPRPLAAAIWGIMKIFDWHGSCSGFSMTSLKFFNDHYSVRSEFRDHDYLFDVDVNPTARSMINANQIRVLAPLADDVFAHHVTSWYDTPVETLEELELSFDQYQNHVSLVMKDPDILMKIHTVQPYRVERNADNTEATIYLYDSNGPDADRTLTIDLSANTWTYLPFGVSDCDRGLFVTPPVSFFINYIDNVDRFLRFLDYRTTDDIIARGLEKSAGNNERTHMYAYVSPTAGILIENAHGEQIGMLDDGEFVHTIPESVPIVPMTPDMTHERPFGYYIPVDEYRVSQYHYTNIASQLSLLNGGALYTFRNTTPEADQKDGVVLRDGLGYVNSDNVQKNIELELIDAKTDSERQFVMRNVGVASGDSVHARITDENLFDFLNIGSEKVYDLDITYVHVNEGRRAMEYRNISIASDVRQTVVPPWNRLDVEPLKILIDSDLDGIFDDSLYVYGDIKTGDIGDDRISDEIPSDFCLYQNYPNPFNASTNIRFSVPDRVYVNLEIFNILGQRVTTLIKEEVFAGTHEVTFNVSHLPSGVYIYRLQAGGYMESRKMLYLK